MSLLTFTGLLCVAPGAHAQSPADCPPVAAMPTTARMQSLAQAARDHGFLWRLTKEGHESWLYGTIHVAKLEWDFPGPKVMGALRAADTLALELDPGDPEVQKRIGAALAAVRRPVLPEALVQRLERASRAECLSTQIDGMAPEVRVMVLGTMIGRRDGIDPAYGIDMVLSGLGHARRMDIVSLETPELQMHALMMPTDEESLTMIERSLDDIEHGVARTQLMRIAQAWAEGDLDALARSVSPCDCPSVELERAAQRRTLDDRNPGLAERIDALHRSGKRVFAAVGSGHMAGPLGLPHLLASRGYRVERIRDPP